MVNVIYLLSIIYIIIINVLLLIKIEASWPLRNVLVLQLSWFLCRRSIKIDVLAKF